LQISLFFSTLYFTSFLILYLIPAYFLPPTDSTISSTPTSTVGSITSHSHSLLERNSGLLAYHAKQLQAAQQSALLESHTDTNTNDHPLHTAFTNHRGLIPRSYSISSTEGNNSNRPLKPVHSPKSSSNNLPRPSFSVSHNNSSRSLGIGESIDFSDGQDVSSQTLAIDTAFSASSEHVNDNAVCNPHDTVTATSLKNVAAFSAEENEWQVEPGTSHTDAPSLLHTINTMNTMSTVDPVHQMAPYPDYTHSVHAQPRYLQEDYQQFQLQQQALHQQRLASNYPHNNMTLSNIPNVFGPGYDFSNHPGAHVGSNALSPSTYNTTVHVHITSPVQSHHALSSAPLTTTTTYSTTNTTTLTAPAPGGSYILPLHVPVPIINIVPQVQQPCIPHPTHVPSPFSGTDRSVGSLEFRNDTSPSLHGLSSSYGTGNNTNRSQYQYEEHSVADSGIGMGNLPLSRTHSGVSTSNTNNTIITTITTSTAATVRRILPSCGPWPRVPVGPILTSPLVVSWGLTHPPRVGSSAATTAIQVRLFVELLNCMLSV